MFTSHVQSRALELDGSDGSKGGARDTRPPPPLGPYSFIFMQFLGNFGQIIGFHPHLGSWRPLSWKSWIHHCIVMHK